MATKTRTSTTPFARFSRLGFGLSSKSHSPSPLSTQRSPEKPKKEEDWYIPYNGPYETPQPLSSSDKKRDSWGDPVYDDGQYDHDALGDELLKRYGVPEQHDLGHHWSSAIPEDDRRSRTRARTQSGVSGRTVSSGTVDPHRTHRATTSSSAPPPKVPSFTGLDPAGGVGESPMPLHVPRESMRRSSFANLFAFGGSAKRSSYTAPPSPTPRAVLHKTPSRRKNSATSHTRDIPATTHSFSGTDSQVSYYATPVLRTSKPDVSLDGQSTEIDYPAVNRHPYASAFPSVESPRTPQTAPLFSSQQLESSRFAAAQPSGSRSPHNTHLRVAASSQQQLKNSISTPDLRNAAAQHSQPSSAFGRKGLPKGKDRWLSAETWCDALLFPRPRFKVKGVEETSGRIVSPPGSPIRGGFLDAAPVQPGVVSRVLAHSRSLVDLRGPPSSSQIHAVQQPPLGRGALQPLPIPNSHHDARTLRPKSFAWDDLALPSPVPSLSK